jgi:hypothetical protein
VSEEERERECGNNTPLRQLMVKRDAATMVSAVRARGVRCTNSESSTSSSGRCEVIASAGGLAVPPRSLSTSLLPPTSDGVKRVVGGRFVCRWGRTRSCGRATAP